jgi:hypothetical protein
VPEGTCVLVTIDQAPMLAFAVCDVALSSSMLFLFAYPLRKHVQRMDKRNSGDLHVLSMLTRNLMLSSLVM